MEVEVAEGKCLTKACMLPHQCLQHCKCKYVVSSEISSHFIHTYRYCFLCSPEEEDAGVGDNTPVMTSYLDSILLYLEMPIE